MTTKTTLLKIVRAKCMDCGCGSFANVAECGCGNCALYPFRLGADPTPARKGLHPPTEFKTSLCP